MDLSLHHITLQKVRNEDIELIRQWRNLSEINRVMRHRDYIDEKKQEEWFGRIQTENNFYFIIQYKGEPVGLINIKDIDWERRTGENGIFIANQNFHFTELTAITSLMIGDFALFGLQLKRLTSTILKENYPVISYNLPFGFQIYDEDEESVYMELDCTYTPYQEWYKGFRKKVGVVIKEENPYPLLSLDERDKDDAAILKMLSSHPTLSHKMGDFPASILLSPTLLSFENMEAIQQDSEKEN